jgi:hypothetical protein
VFVEHRQVVMRVAGQADDVAHRQQGATTGDRIPGRGFEVLQGGGHDDGGGQAVVAAQLAGGQHGAADRDQGVVLALGQGASVGAGVVAGVPVHARGGVVGVARAAGGRGRHHRVEGGAAFGVEQAGDLAHPVGALRVDGDPAAPRPVDVGEVAVGVQQR